MKSILRISIICMLMLGVAISLDSSTTLAHPPKTKFNGYRSGIQTVNLGNTDALITITYYGDDGTVETIGDTISPNGFITYPGTKNPPPPPVSDAFTGSVVISSNTLITAISNILDSGANAYASYIGRSSGAETVYIPLLTKELGGFTTWYSVQNAGGSSANVKINYSDGLVVETTIRAGFAQRFYQSEEEHADGAFSATITSDQPIIAAIIQESTQMLFAYTGFTGGTANPVFPLINQNNNGYRTGVQVQNIGDAATNVTLEYIPSKAGTRCEETINVPPGASATFSLRTFQGKSTPDGGTSTCVKERFIGSAQVKTNSASQPLVGTVNQILPGIQGEAYGSFNADRATNKILMPLIMDRRGGFNTGIAVQHIGGSASDVTCTFSDSDFVLSRTLAVGGSFTHGQKNQIADSYVGYGVCTAANADTKIVGVVNQVKASTTKDLFLVYEAILIH